MITRLRLKNFKSFKELDVEFGPLNLLIGTNASGKSNLREAFRFLHGIGRGYSLIEILGEKWGQGGDLLWTGIRGGPAEVTYWGKQVFELQVEMSLAEGLEARYLIEVDKNQSIGPSRADGVPQPQVVRESLTTGGNECFQIVGGGNTGLGIRDLTDGNSERHINLSNSRPLLSQLVENPEASPSLRKQIAPVIAELARFRFLEPRPEAIRRPCFPGTPLGDHGENLASALYDLRDGTTIEVFNEFLTALTPMDIEGMEFASDRNGRIELIIQENGRREFSLASASDGTLRFLALLALLLARDTKIFLEEIETGLHPSRLTLLLEILQRSTDDHNNQIFATSHSPQLLSLLGEKAAECGYLAFRNEENSCSTLVRLTDLPEDAAKVVTEQDLGTLHTSGWFEDISYFTGVGS